MADQSLVDQRGQRGDVRSDVRVLPDAEVDDLEPVPAELAEILLDLAAQPSGRGRSAQRPIASRTGPTLVTMVRSSGYGESAALTSSLAERAGRSRTRRCRHGRRRAPRPSAAPLSRWPGRAAHPAWNGSVPVSRIVPKPSRRPAGPRAGRYPRQRWTAPHRSAARATAASRAALGLLLGQRAVRRRGTAARRPATCGRARPGRRCRRRRAGSPRDAPPLPRAGPPRPARRSRRRPPRRATSSLATGNVENAGPGTTSTARAIRKSRSTSTAAARVGSPNAAHT